MTVNSVFRALSDPTRREILHLLRDGDLTAGQLAERFARSRSTLSEHCGVLKDAGLVVTERQGNVIVYSLNVSAVEEAVGTMMGLLHVGEDQFKSEKELGGQACD
ncbi:MAG: winged helix-turn-helix transcriptional regulator [Chloroflexi bacterium]|nr:winged helix-turn-helix transcriptional regulator [Chloroflexota bacterium]